MGIQRVNVVTVTDGSAAPVPGAGGVNLIYDANSNSLTSVNSKGESGASFSAPLVKMVKFTKSYTAWKPNATTTGIVNLGQLPAGAVPVAYKIKTSIAFSGVSQAQITLADNGNNGMGNSVDATIVSNTSGVSGPLSINGIFNHVSASNIGAIINVDKFSTIDLLVAGSVDFWVWYTVGV